jgi:hypothetical protein
MWWQKDVGESGEGVASTKSRGTEESVEGKNGPVESVREDGQPEVCHPPLEHLINHTGAYTEPPLLGAIGS